VPAGVRAAIFEKICLISGRVIHTFSDRCGTLVLPQKSTLSATISAHVIYQQSLH
jgi:hypothetical protein